MRFGNPDGGDPIHEREEQRRQARPPYPPTVIRGGEPERADAALFSLRRLAETPQPFDLRETRRTVGHVMDQRIAHRHPVRVASHPAEHFLVWATSASAVGVVPATVLPKQFEELIIRETGRSAGLFFHADIVAR
jgi:hypothetical protein